MHCVGHPLRSERLKKTQELLNSPPGVTDKKLKILIRKGSTLVETSLQDLEESFAFNPSWKAIECGEVVSIPVVEFRTIDQHKPDAFEKTSETQIEHYSVTQTISDLEALVLAKFNEEKCPCDSLEADLNIQNELA